MALFNKAQQASKFGGGIARSFISYKIMFIFAFVILLNSVIISIEQRSIEPGLRDLGDRVLNPLIDLQEKSEEIIKNKGFFNAEDGFISKTGKTFLTYIQFLSPIFTLILWFKVFFFIGKHFIIMDTSRTFNAGLTAFMMLYIVQVLFIMFFSGEEISINMLYIPFKAIITMIKALPFLVPSAVDGFNKVLGNQTG